MFYESILVVALGEHVDYWNRLGWKDIFSALVYTERQRQYTTGFGTGSYTPQAVVNGRYELVGSRTVELVLSQGNYLHKPFDSAGSVFVGPCRARIAT